MGNCTLMGKVRHSDETDGCIASHQYQYKCLVPGWNKDTVLDLAWQLGYVNEDTLTANTEGTRLIDIATAHAQNLQALGYYSPQEFEAEKPACPPACPVEVTWGAAVQSSVGVETSDDGKTWFRLIVSIAVVCAKQIAGAIPMPPPPDVLAAGTTVLTEKREITCPGEFDLIVCHQSKSDTVNKWAVKEAMGKGWLGSAADVSTMCPEDCVAMRAECPKDMVNSATIGNAYCERFCFKCDPIRKGSVRAPQVGLDQPWNPHAPGDPTPRPDRGHTGMRLNQQWAPPWEMMAILMGEPVSRLEVLHAHLELAPAMGPLASEASRSNSLGTQAETRHASMGRGQRVNHRSGLGDTPE